VFTRGEVKRMGRVGRRRAKGDLEDLELYLRDRKIALQRRTSCEVGVELEAAFVDHACARRTVTLHHRRPTGQGGSLRLPRNLVACCDACHPSQNSPFLGLIHNRVVEGLVVVQGPNRGLPILARASDPDWDNLGTRWARFGDDGDDDDE